MNPFLLHSLNLFVFFLSGCASLDDSSFFPKDPYEELREYEDNVGSRIEQYLDVAEQELISNFEKKEYLMIREEQPPPVIHPRKDVFLREIIFSAHQEKTISDQQHTEYLGRCDDLYELWEKHWKIARKKANRLGFKH